MKTTAIVLVWMIFAMITGTFVVALDRNITPGILIDAFGDLNKDVAEGIEEMVDVAIYSTYHQTVTPLVTARAASSLVRGISELECGVSENANYNERISQFINKRMQPDGHFEMWLAANVHTSVVIDVSEMDVSIDPEKNSIDITLPAPYLDVPRVVDFHTSVTEARHLSNEESTGLVAGTFYQHLQRARSSALASATNSTILEEVQSDFTVQIHQMLSNIYPGIEVTVVFTGAEDGTTEIARKE